MTMTIEERVLNGAALLDAKEPGWEAKINLGTLRIESVCACVLGQVYADRAEPGVFNFGYLTGLVVLRITPSEAATYGFTCSDDLDFGKGDEALVALGLAWKKFIAARRVAALLVGVEAKDLVAA